MIFYFFHQDLRLTESEYREYFDEFLASNGIEYFLGA